MRNSELAMEHDTHHQVPIPIVDIIRSYDLTNKPVMGEKFNLFVYDIVCDFSDDRSLLHGRMNRKPHFSLDFVMGNQTAMTSPFPDEMVTIEMEEHVALKAAKVMSIYVHNAEVMTMDPLVLKMCNDSLLIPQFSEDPFIFHPKPIVLEQFAGGFGGWSFAQEVLKPFVQTEPRRVAIETNLKYSVQFALNHHHTIVGDVESLPPNFLHCHSKDVLFIADVESHQWQQQIQWSSQAIWTLSSPCQSWSSAGYQTGLNSQNGRILIHSISQARIFKPTFLGIEQVSGFARHPHFGLVKRILRWANYVLVFERVLELSDVTAVRRQRWLALYVHADAQTTVQQMQPWPKIPMSPKDCDALHGLDDLDVKDFQPSIQVATKYFANDFLPPSRKHSTKAEVIAFRIPGLSEALPTFMKQYGNAHNLDDNLLRTKGLFGAFIKHGDTFRFFTPYEILKLHCQSVPVTLLKPAKLAWETLGNAIMVPHAMYLLFHAFHMLNWIPQEMTFKRCLEQMIAERFTTSNSEVLADDFAWYVGTDHDNLQQQFSLFRLINELQWTKGESHPVWPTGKFFDFQHGLCEFLREEPMNMSTIPPTMPFQVCCLVALAVPPGEYGVLKIDASVTWHTLLKLWDNRFMPMNVSLRTDQITQPIMTTIDFDKILLAPIQFLDCHPVVPTEEPIPRKVPFLLRQDCDLTLYEIEESTTWKHVRAQCKLPDQTMYDSFGQLSNEQTIKHPTLIDSNEHPITAQSTFIGLLHHLTQAKFEVVQPPNTDILLLYVTGTVQAMDAFATIWLSEDQVNWCAKNGRQINVQLLETGAMQVLYRPKLPTTATPTSLFRNMLFIHMMKTAMSVLQQKEGIDWILKYEQRVLFRGKFAPDLSMGVIIPMFEHFFQLRPTKGTPAFITMAKRCGDLCTLFDLQQRSKNQNFVVTMMGNPMIGGTGAKMPTTKQDHHKAIEVGIANMFLEYGINITAVPDYTTALLQTAGEPRLHKLLFAEAPPQKYESFEKLCAASRLALPSHGPRYAQVNAKFKKLRSKENDHKTKDIDVSQFALTPQFFRNADDSHATILQQYTPQSSGVMLMSSKEAEAWLMATTELAPDELAIYIVGHAKVPDAFSHTRIHAPARDSQGREVLLNGLLVQMGSKHIGTAGTTENIQLNDTQICSITVWRNTIEPSLWERITDAPVRTVKELLTLDGHAGLMGKPWGRTFQKDGITVDAKTATSLQFHCEMTKGPRFEAMLRRSGFNHIFVTPKDSDGLPSKHWRIIWLPLTSKEIESKTTSISGTAGLIKGKKAIGLRVEETAFLQAWRKLRPEDDPPDQRIMAHVFKLQPLPLGLDHTILKTWGDSQGWDIKPIKPMGAKQWIVASNTLPPAVLSFNGAPILCQKILQKPLESNQAIVAGPRPATTNKTTTNSKHVYTSPQMQVPNPNEDPWQLWIANQKSKQPRSAEDARPPNLPTPYPEQRSLTGPFADMFQQQDSRIKTVETMVAQLNESQTTQKHMLETQLQTLDTRLTQHVTQTQAGFEHIHQENHNMQRNIADALGKQEERMAKSFEDLKTIFLQNRGTKRKDANHPNRDDEELHSASE